MLVKIVEEVGTNGKSIIYGVTGSTPKIITLTEIFEELEEKYVDDSSIHV